MDLKIPTQPHVLTNEDGHRYAHPGYVAVICLKCGREFVIGQGRPDTTCLACFRNLKELA